MSPRLSSVHRSTIRVSQQARVRRRRRLWALEGLEDRVLLSGSPTFYTVTDTSGSVTDTGSLPYAITEANANGNLAGSVIAFGFTAPQTITLSSTLVLSESAGPEVIDGPSAGVMISGDNAVEVFQVDSGVTATLSGLTISGGSASSGGGIENGGELTVSGSTLSGNSATYGGGGGGGIYNVGILTVTTSTFSGNSAYAGGAGGGIWNQEGTLAVATSMFSGNSALYGGGISNGATLTVSGSTLSDNSAGAGGGGIINEGMLTVNGSTLSGNLAPDGGGIANEGGGPTTVSGSTLSDNSGTDGGGIFNYSATMTVSTSTLSGNSAYSRGGGIANEDGGTLTVSTSTFTGNSTQDGGGIYNSSGTVSVVNSTFSANTANTQGGGIWNAAALTAVNSTIAYNTSQSGGGIYDSGGTATLNNTVVATNTEGTGLGAAVDDLAGSAVFGTSAYNLVGVDNTGSLSSANHNLLNVTNPGLGSLGNNGGPTQTIALLAGSPAINAGSNALAVDPTTGLPLAYDQNGPGFPRIVNGTVDIGAFERPAVIGSPTVYTVDLTSASGAGSGNAGDLVYVIGQADANANLAGSVIQFAPAVFGTPQTITLSSTLVLSEPSGPIAIDGPGAVLATVSGAGAVGVFQVDNGEVASLTGLTITGGSAYQGGGILNLDWSKLTVSGSTVSGNTATGSNSAYGGGGIANGGTMTVSGSTLSGNSEHNGGGIYNVGVMTVSGSTLSDNSGYNGGGIFNGGTLAVSTSTLSGNSATYGAGIFNYNGTLAVSTSTLSGNSVGQQGGGIFNDGTLTMTTSALSGNSASEGGGIFNERALAVATSTFSGNSATYGAGFFNYNGTVAVSSSTLSDNSAYTQGGGIWNEATLTVATSTFSGNSSQYGGGIYNESVTLNLVNSTFSANSANQEGGGIYNAATLMVVNSTIAYNTARSGGGIYEAGGMATLNNTIVATNTEGTGLGAAVDDLAGSAVFGTSAYNLVGVDNTGSLSSASHNLLNVTDPGLGSLGNNGGPTQTIALLAGSPAIDSGSNALAVDPTTGLPLAYDQNGPGFPRIVNGTVDIGAFERPAAIGSPTVYTVDLTSASGAGSGNAGDLVYVIGQADANANLAGSVIQFAPAVFGTPQTITLSSTLVLSEPSGPIAIDGPGAVLATVSGAGAVGVFQVDNGEVASLTGLTITGGSAYQGGGILNLDWSKLTVSGSTVSGNTATGSNSAYGGGGIANGGTMTVSGSTLSGNSEHNGGGIYNVGVMTVSGSTLSDNSGYNGGGIFNGGTLAVSTSTLSGNSATYGAGIFNYNGTLAVSTSTLSGNSVGQQGGGIFNDGTLTMTTSALSGNSASEGGGIFNERALAVATSTFSGNSATYGAGFFNYNGTVAVSSSTLSDNSAYTQGGGIWNEATLTVATSTFSGNSSQYGGGIYNESVTLNLVNSTFSANSANQEGGGIYNAATLMVVNSTIAYNTARSGGGIYEAGGMATLNNTIVATNTEGTGLGAAVDDLAGSAVFGTSAYNLVGVDNTGSLSSASHNLLNVTDPGLGSLGNNGGPTQTIALLAGSPAIDSGSNALAVDPTTGLPLAYDQNGPGFPRIVNGTVDIGAFERPAVIGSPTVYTVDLTSASGAGSGNAGDLVYVIGQADANANLAGSVIQFAPAVFGTPQTITLSSTLVLSEPSGPIAIDGPGAVLATVSGAGAVGVFQVDNGEVASLTGLTITGGSAYQGGGILNLDWSKLTVSGSTVSGNTATGSNSAYGGGGIANGGTMTVSGSTLSGNSEHNGGGIYNVGVMTVSGSTLSDNSGYNGGGIFNGGTLAVSTSTLSGNSATYGAGIFNYNGTLAVSTSTLSGNSVGQQGGGIWNEATLTVATSTFSGNSAQYGGGIFNESGTLSLVNSTFSGNSASQEGGGIYNAATLTAVNSTIAYNTAQSGGGIYEAGGAATLNNTIVATNTVGDLAGPAVFSSASAYNLVGTDYTGSLTSSNHNLLNVTHPGLGSLGSNGGPTQTIAPLNGSPAINAGSTALAVNPTTGLSLAYDQRGTGYPRFVNGTVDIGAVERFLASTTTLSASLSSTVYGQSVTFNAAVTAPPSNTGIPTGTVTIYNGLTALGSATLTGGSVAFPTTALPVGTDAITAVYSGDSSFATSTSAAVTAVVAKDGTTTTASASPSFASVGQTVTFTATVAANAPGSGTPTGTVDFVDTTTSTNLTPGGVALSSGTAAFSTTSLAAGSHTIKATYSGDTNFIISNGSTGSITIGQSIFVLDPSAGGALSLSGNASINIAGGVYVDSCSLSAISVSGNASVKASVIDVHGGVQKSGNASFSPAPTTGAATVLDPLESLPEPITSGLTNYGSKSFSGNSSATICPGIYTGITVSGNAGLTMSSGVYIIEGGGFSISGNASVSGSGVLIVNAGSTYPTTGGTYGSITLSGNGSYNLTPPTTGTYAGIVIFQARDNSKALTISGNASGMTGTVYAPAAQLTESGNAALNAALIVDTLTISGNAINNALSLNAPAGTVAYTPNQIRDAYGINNLALDGTGQTIAIVDAYDDPDIFQAVDAFDTQFTLTDSGPTLYDQYGPASSFLTVLNQYGQATSLPSTDPNGPGTDNWEVEESLDVEWAHAIAPGAQIILVEANSQSLSDLMASVATAASQPGVSVVSMSWGFPEGQSVFASDEATYDSYFDVPGVTFVASTGDYGAADPEYPAFSPNVVAVGGTSLALNADNSYNSETGWGYYSDSVGAFVGSGGGLSLYEPEPAYQQGVQSTGYRSTPDVSLVADPATGAWIADPYNLDPSNPFEIVGGTSLSAPAWAGLLALVNQGRTATGESALNSSTPTDTQHALYLLPQSDYNVIASGNNGFSAGDGYNLVTGLGTPVANLLVPDLIAYQGPGTTYTGPTVGPLQNAALTNTGTSSSNPIDAFSVFDSLTVSRSGFGYVQDVGHGSSSSPASGMLSDDGADTTTMARRYRMTPSAINSTAVAIVVGMMPLDNTMTTPDHALENGSRSRTALATTKTSSRGTDTGPDSSVSRTPVLQAALVDAVIEEFGALQSGKRTNPRGNKPKGKGSATWHRG